MVVCKFLSLDIVTRNGELTDAYVQDKLERKASANLLRCLLTQMSDVQPSIIERSFLDADVLVHRLTDPHEKRIEVRPGLYVIANASTKQVRRILPPNFNVRSYTISNHIVDRCAVNCGLAFYMMHANALWAFRFGIFHDKWNAIKASFKKSNGKRWWNVLVKMASVMNFNHGPFRSGTWGKSKQGALAALQRSTDKTSESFRDAATRQAAMMGRRCDTAEHFDEWWQFLGRLPSALEAGPLLKFARWNSIEQCWSYYRNEIWLTKLVLEFMNPNEAMLAIQTNTTAMLDMELATEMTESKKGLVQMAPTYITESSVDVMEMISLSTAIARKHLEFRRVHLKSPKDHLRYTLHLTTGGWEDEYLEMIYHPFTNLGGLTQIGALDAGPRSLRNCDELAKNVMQLVSENVERELPLLLQYPHFTMLLLDENKAATLESRDLMLAHYKLILEIDEKIAKGDHYEKQVVQSIFWWDYALMRLFFTVLQHEANDRSSVGDQTLHIAAAINTSLPDESSPENMHQHVRDEQRTRRHKNIQVATIYETLIDSGVLESTEVESIKLDKESLCQKNLAFSALQDRFQTVVWRQVRRVATDVRSDVAKQPRLAFSNGARTNGIVNCLVMDFDEKRFQVAFRR
jgi:hypothetical protein